MNILITGGFGYIGGRLAKMISTNTKHRVILGSRKPKKTPSQLPGVSSVLTQWDSPESLIGIMHGIDVVIHASGMNAQDCENDPDIAFQVNGVATSNLLMAAIKKKVGRFIYLSTIHVYGSPLAGRITEDSPTKASHPYATSHQAGEDAVLTESKKGNIKGIVVRLSNAFGSPVYNDVNCWMLLVNDLCRQAVVNRSLVMTSSGKQRRDFVTLFDVVRAISHLLHLPKEQLEDGVFNVGGNWAPCVIDMALLIQSRCSDVLDFVPEIIRPEPSSCESAFDLEYRIDKLLSTGFSLTGCVDDEVDTTLLLCQDVFGKKNDDS